MRLNPDLPAKLEEVINRAVEKDRNLRYQHASDLRADCGDSSAIGYRKVGFRRGDGRNILKCDRDCAYGRAQIRQLRGRSVGATAQRKTDRGRSRGGVIVDGSSLRCLLPRARQGRGCPVPEFHDHADHNFWQGTPRGDFPRWQIRPQRSGRTWQAGPMAPQYPNHQQHTDSRGRRDVDSRPDIFSRWRLCLLP